MRIAVHDFVGHPFVFELSRELARSGHVVRHFFFDDYPGPKGAAEERPDDPPTFSIEPLTLGRAYSTGKFVSRGLNNIAYGVHAGRRIAAFEPDVVLSGNTPTEAQVSIQGATRRVGAAFVYWMQDFYSLAVKLILSARIGALGRMIGMIWSAADRRQLARSDAVVLISDGFRSALQGVRLDEAAVHVVPNWGALSEIPPRPRENAWRISQGLEGRVVFLYSGTLGLKHNPGLLLALADHFRHDPDVVIVAAFSGAGADFVRDEIEATPRPNLRLLPLQPLEDLPDMLGAADVLVALLEADAGRFSVPSKVLSYLCAGRTVLLSAPLDNLASETVQTAEAGLVVDARRVDQFLAAAQILRDQPEVRARHAASGRRYAEGNFEVTEVARRFSAVFEGAIARAGVRVRK